MYSPGARPVSRNSWTTSPSRYAWHRDGDVVHEFRLTGRAPGEYTGYTLHPSEWPEGIA